MASSNNRNLALNLLITAKDEASALFGKVFKALNDSTNVIAGKVRDAFTGIFGGAIDGAGFIYLVIAGSDPQSRSPNDLRLRVKPVITEF